MRKRHTSKGFLSTIQRKSGAVLVYRWYDPGTDGRPTERKRVLGLAKDFRSEAAARREVQRLGLREQIDLGCVRVRQEQHVGFVDRLESTNR